MDNYFLFTDASLNPELKVGVGGYLIVPESLIKTPPNRIKTSELDKIPVLRRFKNTSSTKLEVQTVLWALEEYCIGSTISGSAKLHIYTDSRCVACLLIRRGRLESNNFHSKGGNRLLKNASLYRKYYELHDRLKFEVTKVSGHTRSHSRNTVQRIFAFIDQKTRKSLKQWITQLEAENAEWYLYMIRCSDGALYTGISNDVNRRFEKHQEMGKQAAKYLRGKGPIKLVFQKKIGSKSSALKVEQKIKKLAKPEKESIIKKGDIELDIIQTS
ncbi:MAG: GIY-YIG nuclease family protein [Candidatus Anammoxibacter sp.]